MSGQFPAYPQYVDGVIDWADSLPAAWSYLKLRWAASIYAGGTPSKNNLAFWENGTIPWLNSGSVNQGIVREVSAFITKAALENSSAKWIKRGSLVVALAGQGKTKGTVAQLDIDATCNQSMAAIVPSSKLQPRFLFWWLSSNYQNIRNMAGGDLRDGLNLELLGNIQCPLPTADEQTQIAKFLDYETAKIDALIAKQQQLIALLQEKRQAVISHAVTKGLNPAAPLRDSGVEWLGQVPAHWTVSQLKYNTSQMQTGPFGSQLHAEDYIQGGIPLVNPIHIINGRIIPESNCSVDSKTYERLARHKLHTGDIIFARRGELGRCAVVREEQDGWLCGSGSLRATLLDRLSPEYAFMLISSSGVRSELALESRGSTMDNLNTDTLGRVRLPVPPLDEQMAILRHIEEISGQFDKLEKLAVSQSELLHERRTALISAAVTGKIDVRGWQPPPAAAAGATP